MDDATRRIVEALNAANAPGDDRATAMAGLTEHLKACRDKHESVDLAGAVFTDAQLTEVNFHGANLASATFRGCNLVGTVFESALLPNARFLPSEKRPTHIVSARFARAYLKGAIFNCIIEDVGFTSTDLNDTVFDGSRLRSCKFTEAKLHGASFLGIDWDETIAFQSLDTIAGATFDRYTLASLGKESGLTIANMMDITIVDDVAKLRREFGGVWAIAHAAALIVFAYPYAKFLFLQSLVARFHPPDGDSISLIGAMARFVASGGQSWKSGWAINWISLASFVFYLIYNVARGLLLWKTKRLETEQDVSGLPVKFSLTAPTPRNRWNVCYQLVKALFWIAAVAVAVNTWHFMMQRVPLD